MTLNPPEPCPGSVMEPVWSRRDGREREGDTGRERDRQTERQKEGEGDRQTDRQRERETERGGERQRQTEAEDEPAGRGLRGPALAPWAPPAPGQEDERPAGPHGLQEPQRKLGSAVAQAG